MKRFLSPLPILVALLPVSRLEPQQSKTVRLRGEIVAAADGARSPARIYIQGEDGEWRFPTSDGGTAVTYKKKRAKSVEMHTTLSAHPFHVDLPPGKYVVTVERGHEFEPLVREITLKDEPVDIKLPLVRWIDMAQRRWYSGETHVHRPLEELPNLMLAEDLNVAFPLTAWVTEGFAAPRNPLTAEQAKIVNVDATHLIYPRNTEYEIFTIGKRPHTLGAFFVINHKTAFDKGVPPVAAIGKQARAEGALLDLDKPNWPWSMIVAALLKIDLYELANNHVWRTEFGFPAFGDPPGEYMKVERDLQGVTERGWIDFGFQNYYALLNCGFRMRPTAGTANGVHPVPLGFGRVYVRQPNGFGYDSWVKGLDRGDSFVTTGPMLFVTMDDKAAGSTFQTDGREFKVAGAALSRVPLDRIEIVVNGEVARTVKPLNRKTPAGAFESPIDEKIAFVESGWLIVRCYEDRPDKRVRFAHTSPFHVEVSGKPVRPRRAEIDFLLKRVTDEISRSKDVLPRAALDEYREALRIYETIAKTARN